MADKTREGNHRQTKEYSAGGSEITIATELTLRGIQSLELADIIRDLEQSNGIKIEMNTDDAWSNLKHVGDAVEAVHGLLAKKA
ncbi:acyl carrier protein [Bradyrhizobium murdochi]|uniref:acyl carrier protein n=1 Tax=Bradyrhizobium murdochi TaxID=1038859 RepID=UPI000411131A|nr:acyl carrier protein [Bradyrhizobium murdochi]